MSVTYLPLFYKTFFVIDFDQNLKKNQLYNLGGLSTQLRTRRHLPTKRPLNRPLVVIIMYMYDNRNISVIYADDGTPH